jgi:hypothetical protein
MIVYFVWWYGQTPIFICQAIINITQKIFSSFSVVLLLKTLFDPWKRDVLAVENASLDVRFNLWLQNLVSRLVGFVVRFFTIIAGLISTAVVFIFLLAIFLVWLLMPIIIIFLIVNGIRMILNG